MNLLKYDREGLYLLNINGKQTGNKPGTQPITEPVTNVSSSGSIYINTTTTGENHISEKRGMRLPAEWQDLDIKPLASIGFTKTHLSQIASQDKLSAQVVQDSIYSLAFDLKENDKAKSIKGDPINFFMGILRNGKPYLPPSNYESPQDKALRIYQERMQKLEHEREAREKEAKDLAYKDWFSKLTDDQKRQHLPENLRRNARLEKNKMLAQVY